MINDYAPHDEDSMYRQPNIDYTQPIPDPLTTPERVFVGGVIVIIVAAIIGLVV